MSLVRRRLIGLGLLLVVLAAVVVGAALLERHDSMTADADEAAAKLIGMKPADVHEVVLDNANGHFVIVRDGGSWRLKEPLDQLADASIVDGIVNAIADVSRTQLVQVDGKPPAEPSRSLFGLAPPRASVSLDGAKTLDIGKRNEFNGEVYARVRDSDAIVMVGSAIEFQVEKTLFDLREKRLVVFDPSDIESLEVTRPDGGGVYSIVRENGESYVSWPGGPRLEADPTQVSAVESALANLRALRFLDGEKSSVSTHVVRARFTLHNGVTHTLVIGNVDGVWRATLAGESAPTAEVSGEWVSRKLDIDPKTLRDLRLVRFKRDDVDKISIARDRDSVTIARDEAGVWRIGEQEADSAQVSGLLYRLFGLRADQVLVDSAGEADLAAAGLAVPALRVELARRDGTAIAVLNAGKDARGRTTSWQQGSGRIDLAPAEAIDDISAKQADYLPDGGQATK